MSLRQEQNIDAVVQSGLCNSCGTCAGLCPVSAITLHETPGGLLRPVIDHTACTNCGRCVRVCPGVGVTTECLSDSDDPFTGNIIDAYMIRATDEHVMNSGQSAGAVTALLLHGIRTGVFDKAAVTQLECNGAPTPSTILTSDESEIRRAQRSKYCPTPAGMVLKDIIAAEGKAAFVGLSCHLHGIQNAQSFIPALNDKLALSIGLFCDRVLSFVLIDYLLHSIPLDIAEVAEMTYVRRDEEGWSGHSCFKAKGGKEYFIDNKLRTNSKEFFTPTRCRLCFDKLNVFSDLAVGDAWGIAEGARGASVVLVRTDRGADFLQSAIAAKAVSVETIKAAQVIEGQGITKKRREFAAYSHLWKELSRRLPEFNIPKSAYDLDSKTKWSKQRKLFGDSLNLESANSTGSIVRRALWRFGPKTLRTLFTRCKKRASRTFHARASE